jgi:hypothetical protein
MELWVDYTSQIRAVLEDQDQKSGKDNNSTNQGVLNRLMRTQREKLKRFLRED